MTIKQAEIQEIVDRETKAWDSQDIDLLMTLFHQDAVWPFPPDPTSHDPATWVLEFGKYDYDRWSGLWLSLFDEFELVHNRRSTICIKVSKEGDGAFAVVDIDTLWRHRKTGEDFLWKGRTCKIYTLTEQGWKMITQTGVLDYSGM